MVLSWDLGASMLIDRLVDAKTNTPEYTAIKCQENPISTISGMPYD
jgi:hypothetical protein